MSSDDLGCRDIALEKSAFHREKFRHMKSIRATLRRSTPRKIPSTCPGVQCRKDQPRNAPSRPKSTETPPSRIRHQGWFPPPPNSGPPSVQRLFPERNVDPLLSNDGDQPAKQVPSGSTS